MVKIFDLSSFTDDHLWLHVIRQSCP